MNKINQLLDLNVNEYTQEKGKLAYLSWANAWREFLKVYPNATYKIRRKENGDTWFGNSEVGYMVYTEVTADQLTHEMWLPVMDYRNKSVMKPTTFDINKAIMRCLTKNLAMFGLGLYIYAGEDLPEEKPVEIDLLTKEQSELIDELISKAKDQSKTTNWLLRKYKVKNLGGLNTEQADEIIKIMEAKAEEDK